MLLKLQFPFHSAVVKRVVLPLRLGHSVLCLRSSTQFFLSFFSLSYRTIQAEWPVQKKSEELEPMQTLTTPLQTQQLLLLLLAAKCARPLDDRLVEIRH